MPWLTLTLLGGFRARLGSGRPVSVSTKKGQALLAYLALRHGQPELREKLATLLWGDSDDEQARHSLRQTLFELRASLPRVQPPVLIATDETLALDPEAVEVDVVRFESLVCEGTPAALTNAATRYQGDLLEGFSVSTAPFEEWLRSERERLRARALEALNKLLVHQAQSDDLEPAVRTAARLLALDPLQEPVHRVLMRLYARRGWRGAALRQYQTCVDVLQRELGVEPEADTKQLYRELLPYGVAAARTPESGASEKRRVHRVTRGPEPASAKGGLVGRGPEMNRLHRALSEAWRDRNGTVIILGDAGVGKTRLVRELAARAAKRRGQVLLGRGYESEQVLAFGPWVDALRGWLQTHRPGLGGLAPVWRTELSRLLPELAESDLSPLASSEDHLRLFDAVTHLVEHLASRHPLLVVLEDVHWADEMSLRLLSYLGRRLVGVPVLVVATARADELAGSAALIRALEELRQDDRLVTVALPPLSREDSAKLIRTLAGPQVGRPRLALLEEQVCTLSEGNPFMIVETMRAIREGRAVETSEGLQLPERVREVIAGRLARLSILAQELAGIAALIGREFEFPVLQRAAALDAHTAAHGVEELVRRRILHGVGERFDFSHDRIREVARDRSSPPHQRSLHTKVGNAMEEVYADCLAPHYAALAAHYRRGEVWDKAVGYLRQAGIQAMERSAYREAIHFFKEGLAALQYLPRSRQTSELAIDLRLDLRRCLRPLGELPEIFEYLREAEGLADSLGDDARLGRVLTFMIQEFSFRGQRALALQCGERALAVSERVGDASLRAATNFFVAEIHYYAADYRRGAEFFRRSVEATLNDPFPRRLEMTSLPSVISRAFLTLCLASLGEFDAAGPYADEAVRMAQTAAHPYSLAYAYLGLGALCMTRGDLDEAIAALEQGHEVCRLRELEQPVNVTMTLGFALVLKGRYHEGLPLVELAARKVSESRVRRATVASFVARLADAYLMSGRAADVRPLAERALVLARTHAERHSEAYSLLILGKEAGLGDTPQRDRSETLHRDAMAQYAKLGMRPALASCYLSLGRLYAHWGRREQARTEIGEALQMYRALGAKALVSRAEQALAALS